MLFMGVISMKTKYGNAKINPKGYYHITSGKEGNNGKLLHRLIYEDFWGITLPSEIDIHHKDGNKINNCILNLEALSHVEHSSSHKTGENHYLYGKTHSDETRRKISESQNNSGYYRVYKNNDKNCKQGFIWRYLYYENGKQKSISSVNIEKLEEKVLAKGLEWINFSDGCYGGLHGL